MLGLKFKKKKKKDRFPSNFEVSFLLYILEKCVEIKRRESREQARDTLERDLIIQRV